MQTEAGPANQKKREKGGELETRGASLSFFSVYKRTEHAPVAPPGGGGEDGKSGVVVVCGGERCGAKRERGPRFPADPKRKSDKHKPRQEAGGRGQTTQ